ncbi:enoyl-CoA hydratase/isomerase family protein [Nocardia seriolae]|uniref:3-hydroxyisobutyryl-CoA hydrolase n=1 Tax=Nocardia seriolae TaxID=37332 RepID=A0A0B8NGD1_9NOCA|nr:enoyl-CoA hydratase-related protein [Nocardia seriolae]APA98090.1 3-hydroxyisobutyryl-CoA hydrolase [Nocardia seriolae]MTJ62784.1 enoyl-CoA hydratase [Nocardia seriolae]MTJ73878.1 enoyl-CoA hydratase [Nocardia seriolae]MTJ87817.1 enoyl-CoA hydratase [Nocardia seriolae]MTK31810.1 enoyl-CoA hydratase [Nocardia seriolae]
MTKPEPDVVLAEDRGPVRIITLNRPERRNAIDIPLRVALAERLEAAMADPGVRVIVVTGAGKAFCAGGDISTMERMAEAASRPRAQAAQRVVRAIWEGPKPVLAAVEGLAFGAGVSLALACDRVISAEDAVFSTAFTGVGLAGDMGIFASLPARVGPARAKQLMLLPRKVSGSAAFELGMADAVVPPGTALECAIADAERIAALAPLALGELETNLGRWPCDPVRMLDHEVDAQVRLFDTEDFAEGVAAFHERRLPQFHGR